MVWDPKYIREIEGAWLGPVSHICFPGSVDTVSVVSGLCTHNTFTLTPSCFPLGDQKCPCFLFVCFTNNYSTSYLNTFDLGDVRVVEDEDPFVTGGYCGFGEQSGVSKETA